MLRLLVLILIALPACKRPIPEPAPPAVIEQPAPTPTSPEEPKAEPPQLTPEILTAVQDDMHRRLDRSLGVAVTMDSYAERPDPARVGTMKWYGEQAHFQIASKLFTTVTPSELPCDVINAGDWRSAWAGRGGTATTFDIDAQWWRFKARPHDAYVRVGATELTAMVFDTSRRCWTGKTILEADRRMMAGYRPEPTGSMKPGKANAAIFGTDGKIEVSTKKIFFFDGKARVSFEPRDRMSCAWAAWGKHQELHWFSARMSSGKQADGCLEDVDVSVEELIEFRDKAGELVYAARTWTPGDRAPVGKHTYYIRHSHGAATIIYEGTDEHGATPPPEPWEERCKAVHRNDLRQPLVAVASQQKVVGLWSLTQDGKDVVSSVGQRLEVQLDCVPVDD